MDSTRVTWSADLPSWALYVALLLWLAGFALLAYEARRSARGKWQLFASGLLASTLLLVAVARPVRVSSKDVRIGPKVVVLADTSRSMAIQQTGENRTRADVRNLALDEMKKRAGDVRLDLRSFAEGKPQPFSPTQGERGQRSDLRSAMRGVLAAADERPLAFVVVSDGTLDDPHVAADAAALSAFAAEIGVPVSTVATTQTSPKDASIRRVNSARTSVAHVPFSLRVEVACTGGLQCEDLTVAAKELREEGAPALLASGIAHVEDGKALVDLTVTLERAGTRTLALSIETPAGDTIPENNTRYLTFEVARERVRILHVAGRPTNDVRALRSYLKQNASVDVVAFFILRAPNDYPKAGPDELSLIPFPVDELFSDHLPSFDAIVLQDFDAQPYGLGRHLPAIQRYVRAGGGLVMVGGANSFVAGGYAGTPLASVLPVGMDGSPGASAADVATFEPSWTTMGQQARLLGPLREVVGNTLPPFAGTNLLGDVVPGAIALWTHPTRRTPSGAPMPVLAVGDMGDGRAIALGVDGTWSLEFSDVGARTAGRGYSALWDGLLGWLMRDPRFEPSQIEVPEGCIADVPTTLRIGPLPEGASQVTLEVGHTDGQRGAKITAKASRAGAGSGAPAKAGDAPQPGLIGEDGVAVLTLPALPSGGYVATAHIEIPAPGGGTSVATKVKRDLACEVGGDEWADSEVHPEHLERLAKATSGSAVDAEHVRDLRFPKPTVVSSEKRVAAVAPAWLWALLATAAAGLNWYLRRTRGLA